MSQKKTRPDRGSSQTVSTHHSWYRWMLLALVLAALTAAGALYAWRSGQLPPRLYAAVRAFIGGYAVDHHVRIRMPDGVELAASLYKPSRAQGPLPTIYVRLPYGRKAFPSVATNFTRFGYAVLVQDVRGKFDSQGEFRTWQHATSDGMATLDWVTRQPWSNGRVGTFGCSALGELQYALARGHHPAHRAMIAAGAGGGLGVARGGLDAFGWFEGGILQLAPAFGWFQLHGTLRPEAPITASVDHAQALKSLPLVQMLQRVQPGPNGFDDFLNMPLHDSRWQSAHFDFVGDGDTLRVPALAINTWGDQTLTGTLTLADIQAASGVRQHVILAPGNHCEHLSLEDTDHFGDLEVRHTALPYMAYFRQWFDFWLKGEGEGLKQLPPYLYYVVGEHQWMSADQWPPRGVQHTRWYLASDQPANGAKGGGVLLAHARDKVGIDSYRSDPLNPVPTRGGPICCTGNPADRSGPVDQREVEARDDVLVYTSEPLGTDLRIAGPLSARLRVSSSARDTDVIARLVHVWPDGRATNIQEGALRMRYRDGINKPVLMEPGRPYDVEVSMRSMAYLVPKGHRIRLTLSSSSFPRLARNLQTGGPVHEELDAVVATNQVHHGGGADATSYVSLPVLAQPSVWRP